MINDIIETTKRATELNMTYGAYVALYGSVVTTKKPKQKKIKKCPCGKELINRHSKAVYCEACVMLRAMDAKERHQKKMNAHDNVIVTRKLKELKSYKDRLTIQQYKTLRGQIIAGDFDGAKKGLPG